MTVFWLDREEAIRRIRRAAERLVADRPEVHSVHLFGSLAEDRAVPSSDADVLILLTDSDRPWIERPLEYDAYFDRVGLAVELFCYTREEIPEVPLARRALQRAEKMAG